MYPDLEKSSSTELVNSGFPEIVNEFLPLKESLLLFPHLGVHALQHTPRRNKLWVDVQCPAQLFDWLIVIMGKIVLPTKGGVDNERDRIQTLGSLYFSHSCLEPTDVGQKVAVPKMSGR